LCTNVPPDILDRDPYCEPERIKDFRVKMTIVAGNVAYRG
jgi:predicted amidohydrolase YtcJ